MSIKGSKSVRYFFFVLLSFTASQANSQYQVVYPYPVYRINLPMDDTIAQMAYMDAAPLELANNKVVLLLDSLKINKVIGHIPHIQDTKLFLKQLLPFIKP